MHEQWHEHDMYMGTHTLRYLGSSQAKQQGSCVVVISNWIHPLSAPWPKFQALVAFVAWTLLGGLGSLPSRPCMCQLDTVCLNSTAVGRYNYIYRGWIFAGRYNSYTHNYCISDVILCVYAYRVWTKILCEEFVWVQQLYIHPLLHCIVLQLLYIYNIITTIYRP